MNVRRVYLVLPALILVAMMLPLWGGFTDDGYIHVQYARNLIERGEYSFNPGEISFGTTSPLWVMMLASLGSVSGNPDFLVPLSQVLSWLSALFALLVVYAVAVSMGARPFTALLCTTVMAADAWFVRWSALGMESSTAVLAVLLMGWASTRACHEDRWAALLGLFMVLASLVRPEVYLAFPVYAGSLLWRRHKLRLRCVVLTLAVAGALLIPWLLFAKFYIGSVLPNTAGAKSGGVLVDPVVWLRKLIPIAKIVGSTQGLPLLAAVVSLLVMRGRSRVWNERGRFVVLWTLALPVAYVLFDIQVLSRYMLLVTPFVCVLGFIALEQLTDAMRSSDRTRRAVLVAVTVVVVGVNVGFYASVVVAPSRAFTHDLTHNMRSIGEYLHDNADPEAVVAAADIGYLAFYSGRRVLDLGGLVETEMGKLRTRHSYEHIVANGLYLDIPGYPRVDYFIDRDLERSRFTHKIVRGYRFEPVFETTVRNLGIRKPGPYYYTVYKLIREN